MDLALLIRQRMRDLRLDQKDLANAAQVTESYISQLLTRKKPPPAPGRTDLYERLGKFLELPDGKLSELAAFQRRHELKKKVLDPARPLFKECRLLMLRKCEPGNRAEVQRIFEKEAFGELERLVTQKVFEVAQGLAREELRNEGWLRKMAELSGRSYEQMRVAILEFLDTDVLHISLEACVSFLDPMIDYWDIDLKTFGMEIVLNARLTPRCVKRFEFIEIPLKEPFVIEPGLEQFLKDKSLSGDASEDEIEFLRAIKFRGRRPGPMYYYRELQSLRDPLHFPNTGQPR